MTNWKHLVQLRQGATSWNLWRQQHPYVRVELSYADLSKADLRGANLTGAYMPFANLREAKLNDADLRKAHLCRVDLWGADLCGANLSEAELMNANLQRANLEKAQLHGANCLEADLRGVPWLIVMDLLLQPGVNGTGILWDSPTDEKGASTEDRK